MADLYKIGITIAVVNQASAALGVISREFNVARNSANGLLISIREMQVALGRLRLGAIGGVIGIGAGVAGLSAIKNLTDAASDYTHEIELLNAAGLKQAEVAEAVNAAWKTSRDVLTTTPTANLKAIGELRTVFGDTADAIKYLPDMQRIQGVLDAVLHGESGVGAKDVAYATAKALELRGVSLNPQEFMNQSNLITKAVVATRGKVDPQMLLQSQKYGGVGATGYSNDFMWGIVPSLVQELGGSSTGTALTSMYRAVIGGIMAQRSLKMWQDLGLIEPGKEIWNKVGTLKGIEAGGIVGHEAFRQSPLLWAQEYLRPAMERHGVTDPLDQNAMMERMFSNRTAARIGNILLQQGPRLQKDANIIDQSGGVGTFQRLVKQDPVVQNKALAAQWDSLKIAFGTTVIPILIPAMRALTDALSKMAEWAKNNPETAKFLVEVVAGVSALAIAIGGAAIVAGGIAAIAAVPWVGIGAAITAGVAAIVAAVALLRDKIAGFVSGLWQGSWLQKAITWHGDGLAPPPANAQQKQQVGNVYLGPHQVGKVVMEELNRSLGRPLAGTSGHDTRSVFPSPAYVGVGP